MAVKVHKNRLDAEVVRQGLLLSIEEAKSYIMAGSILVAGQIVYKADTMVTQGEHIEIKKRNPYVSRGALKIEKAFEEFAIDVNGLKVVDIGISRKDITDRVKSVKCHLLVSY